MTYSYSTNEENYTGHYETEYSAAENAFNDDTDIDSVFVGENKELTAHNFVSVDSIIDDICEYANDIASESSYDWCDDLLQDKAKKLELQKMIGDFIQLHYPVKFLTVENIREFTREEIANKLL